MKLEILIYLAGILHLGLLGAGLLMPKVTGLWKEIAVLSPFARQLFLVYFLFIGFCLVSFCLLSLLGASMLTAGTPLAKTVCWFLTGFYTLRLAMTLWLFDVTPFLTTTSRKYGYHFLNTAFAILPLLYGYVGWVS